jgi:hypothetical protein
MLALIAGQVGGVRLIAYDCEASTVTLDQHCYVAYNRVSRDRNIEANGWPRSAAPALRALCPAALDDGFYLMTYFARLQAHPHTTSVHAPLLNRCHPLQRGFCQSLTPAIKGANSTTRSKKSCLISERRSLSARIRPRDSWCCPSAGSLSARWRGSTAVEGSRIGRTSIAQRSCFYASPQSGLCSESLMFPDRL